MCICSRDVTGWCMLEALKSRLWSWLVTVLEALRLDICVCLDAGVFAYVLQALLRMCCPALAFVC